MEISTSKTTYSANTNSANFCGPKINTTIKNTSTYSSNESLYNDSNNPYNKIDAYRKNHATDEQIKKDIEKYNSTVTDQFLKLDVDEALSNIKKEISKEKSNPFEGQTISPSNPLDQAAPISSNPNEQYAIPSAKNWYDKNKISDTSPMITIDLDELEYIDDKSKKHAQELQNNITEQRRILAALEGLKGDFKHYIIDTRDNINARGAHNDSGISDFKKISITVGGVVYSYNKKQGEEALDIINQNLDEQKNKVYAAEKELWEYKVGTIKDTDYYKNYIKNLDVEKTLTKSDDIKGYGGYSVKSKKTYIVGDSNYKYMLEREKQFYCYLLNSKGKTFADSYLSSIQGDINSREGLANALKYVSSLDLNDPKAGEYLSAHFKGLSDGIDQFFHGIDVWFTGPSKVLTSKQYEVMYITQLLSQSNANVNLGFLGEFNALEKVYTLSISEGNMLPSMLAGTLGALAGHPEIGALTMFASVAGNSTEASYQQGYDIWSSWVYGLMSGASEATLEYLLGGIPGISKMDDFGMLAKAVHEGFEESLQEILDPYLRNLAFGEEIKLDGKKILEAGIDGMILALYLNGGELVISGTTVTLDSIKGKYDLIKQLESEGVKIDYTRIAENGYLQNLESDVMNNTSNVIKNSNTTMFNFLKSGDRLPTWTSEANLQRAKKAISSYEKATNSKTLANMKQNYLDLLQDDYGYDLSSKEGISVSQSITKYCENRVCQQVENNIYDSIKGQYTSGKVTIDSYSVNSDGTMSVNYTFTDKIKSSDGKTTEVSKTIVKKLSAFEVGEIFNSSFETVKSDVEGIILHYEEDIPDVGTNKSYKYESLVSYNSGKEVIEHMTESAIKDYEATWKKTFSIDETSNKYNFGFFTTKELIKQYSPDGVIGYSNQDGTKTQWALSIDSLKQKLSTMEYKGKKLTESSIKNMSDIEIQHLVEQLISVPIGSYDNKELVFIAGNENINRTNMTSNSILGANDLYVAYGQTAGNLYEADVGAVDLNNSKFKNMSIDNIRNMFIKLLT